MQLVASTPTGIRATELVSSCLHVHVAPVERCHVTVAKSSSKGMRGGGLPPNQAKARRSYSTRKTPISSSVNEISVGERDEAQPHWKTSRAARAVSRCIGPERLVRS